MAALRPLLTATAAGGLLAALWFVPSANATVEVPERAPSDAAQEGTSPRTDRSEIQQASDSTDVSDGTNAPAGTPDGTNAADGTGTAASTRSAQSQDPGLALADTGSVDTTPYVIGGTAFLGIGAGFVTYSVRRRGAAGATGLPGGLA